MVAQLSHVGPFVVGLVRNCRVACSFIKYTMLLEQLIWLSVHMLKREHSFVFPSQLFEENCCYIVFAYEKVYCPLRTVGASPALVS